MNFSGRSRMASLNASMSLNSASPNSLPLESIGRPLVYFSRQRPMGSKLSNAKPSGSMRAWQLAQVWSVACCLRRSRMVRPLASMVASSASISGTTSGGGGGGSLKIVVATHAPRLMGLVRNGVAVIVSTAAVVITPPSRRLCNIRLRKFCVLVLKRLRFPLLPKGLPGDVYQACNSSERYE